MPPPPACEPPRFDRFVAIDWSGARGPRYAGVAVAECVAGDGPPGLVDAPAGYWTRHAVFDWLLRGLEERGPALVGIDCAFSLPFAVAKSYFPGEATVFDLWERVEAAAAGAPDFLGSPFAAHPAYAADFWSGGRQPAWYADPHRATERACRADGHGAPQSPYKLIGPKQVGLGALAGMRMLRALRAADPRVAVWPFDEAAPGRTVFVEIYPRLFLRHAGVAQKKIRTPDEVDAALARLDARPAGLPAAVSDHDADALVSAAGLRWLAGRPGVWAPPALDGEARRREGWIFGVGDRA